MKLLQKFGTTLFETQLSIGVDRI